VDISLMQLAATYLIICKVSLNILSAALSAVFDCIMDQPVRINIMKASR